MFSECFSGLSHYKGNCGPTGSAEVALGWMTSLWLLINCGMSITIKFYDLRKTTQAFYIHHCLFTHTLFVHFHYFFMFFHIEKLNYFIDVLTLLIFVTNTSTFNVSMV